MNQLINKVSLIILVQVAALGFQFALAGTLTELSRANLAHLDSPALKIISDEDSQNLQMIKLHIKNDFIEFKNINDVLAFLDKVKLLVQKHPTNVAFAKGDLKELLNFLSSEIVTRLIRVDTDPFIMPVGDDKIPLALRAIEEDDLTRKLFGGPLRSLVEVRKQQLSRTEEGNHEKDGTNFFTNFWCKISGGCSQHQ